MASKVAHSMPSWPLMCSISRPLWRRRNRGQRSPGDGGEHALVANWLVGVRPPRRSPAQGGECDQRQLNRGSAALIVTALDTRGVTILTEAQDGVVLRALDGQPLREGDDGTGGGDRS